MKKKLSFLSTVIVGIATLLVLGVAGVWLTESFNLPDWTIGLVVPIAIVAYWEVVSFLGPKQIESPTGRLIKLPGKDKVVLCVAFFVWFGIARLGVGFQSGGVNLIFLILGVLAFRFILSSFGSEQLSGKISKDLGKN